MKILLTGATGFLGRQILQTFMQKGYEVIITCQTIASLEALSYLNIKQVKILPLDKLSIKDFFESNPNIDIIVHTATKYNYEKMLPTSVFWTNEVFAFELLECAILHKIKYFINMDTFFNTKESSYNYLSAYTLSKKHFREWGEYYALQNYLTFINLKLFHLFGPNDNSQKFIPNLIRQCLNGESIDLTTGEQKRDFIYSQDVVNAIDIIINAKLDSGYHAFDVGRGESVSVKNFAKLINKVCGSKASLNFGVLPTRQGEPMETVANIECLKKMGWFPKVSLEEGLLQTIRPLNKIHHQ